MSEIVLKGLVLRTADYKESSKMLTVLTDELGKISVCARSATRMKSRIAAACQPLAFSEMTLAERNDKYYLNEASTLELFSGMTADLKSYALGCYFLELLDAACPETQPEPEALSLGLNALWLLSEGKKERKLIKSVFEFRLMSVLGYQPETQRCAVCGMETPENPYLDLRGGELFCRSCAMQSAQRPAAMDEGSLAALRYLLRAPGNKAFAFRLEAEPLRRLGDVAEAYAKEQLERSFRTLDYYKSI